MRYIFPSDVQPTISSSMMKANMTEARLVSARRQEKVLQSVFSALSIKLDWLDIYIKNVVPQTNHLILVAVGIANLTKDVNGVRTLF